MWKGDFRNGERNTCSIWNNSVSFLRRRRWCAWSFNENREHNFRSTGLKLLISLDSSRHLKIADWFFVKLCRWCFQIWLAIRFKITTGYTRGFSAAYTCLHTLRMGFKPIYYEGRKGGKGGCHSRFTGIKIENSPFTEIKTDFSRITYHSACALIFHPYSTSGLTCWPFCMIIACTLNNCFSRSNTKFTLIHNCMPLPTHQDGVENRDKACCPFASPISLFQAFS